MERSKNLVSKRKPFSMSSSKNYHDEPNIAQENEGLSYNKRHLNDFNSHDFNVGNQVQISGQESGVIKYLGTTHFQVH